jgi:ubiquinone/menaquinone biosynthesis C-methylase UbiE
MQDFYDRCKPLSDERVLDVGASGDEAWEVSNTFLREYRHPENTTVLGIDDYDELRPRYPQVRFVTYDGGVFPFGDNSFDICYSNAVIEHVGGRERQQSFLNEMVRVAERGFFTTPNRWFPVDLHTRLPLVHYFPRATYVEFAAPFKRGRFAQDVNLLGARDIRTLIAGTPVTLFRIIPNRLFGFVVTYSIYWEKQATRGSSAS